MEFDLAPSITIVSLFLAPIRGVVFTFGSIDWLPNHLLVLFITIVFAVLNPLILPFALIYFAIERGTSQLVYKNSDTDVDKFTR